MIIHSLLDNDVYKYTMMQAVIHNYYATIVKYRYKCRTEDYIFTPKQVQEIQQEVKYLCTRKLNDQELYYLSTLRYFKPDFIDYLRNFHLDYRFITINDEDECGLNIEIKGPWANTILFEVPILAIISEIVARKRIPDLKMNAIKDPLKEKIAIANKYDGCLKFADFGTRRRFSFDVQKLVVMECAEKAKGFVGTSNLFLAYNNGYTPIGTMAHEWLMAHQALDGSLLRDFQKKALEVWAKEYRGDLGIALTDTIGIDAFLRDFDLFFCKLFDGVRHDSGCPFEFGDKVIDHYTVMGIDPKMKTIVFSDGLNFKLMEELYNTFNPYIKVSFGIGTNLTNDVGNKPLSMVIKMVECNGLAVAKLSDSKGKTMLDDDSGFLTNLKMVFEIKD